MKTNLSTLQENLKHANGVEQQIRFTLIECNWLNDLNSSTEIIYKNRRFLREAETEVARCKSEISDWLKEQKNDTRPLVGTHP